MKNLFIPILTLFYFSFYGQITILKKFSLPNEKTKIVKIFIPKGYEKDNVAKYPLAIVLNDQYLFNLYKGNAQLFANTDLAPKQIIVGIPTNQSTNEDISFVKRTLGLTKNSKIFYDFIINNLIPYINSTYKVSPFTTLIGQGNAANFTTYFLKDQKPIFNAYICIDPIINERTNFLIKSYNLKRLDNIKNKFFLYVSSNPFKKIKSKNAFNKLKTYLSSFDNKNLKLEFDDFKNTPNILSALSESIPRALSTIFKLYRNISKKEFNEKVKDLDPLAAIKYVEQKYIDIEYLYGTNLNVRLDDIYAIEGIVTDKLNGDYLRVLGDFTLIKHPDLPLGDYYIGRFHEIGGDYEKADSYYKTGYGKMDPADPKADAFYKNIDRVAKKIKAIEQNSHFKEKNNKENNEINDEINDEINEKNTESYEKEINNALNKEINEEEKKKEENESD